MAEYAVEQNAYALLPRCRTELRELLIRPQDRIDFMIVPRIVMVIRRGFKNRIQIDDRDSHFLQVGKAGTDAGQIAAKEIIGHDFLRIDIFIVKRRILPAGMVNSALLPDERIARPAEAIRENLVHHRMLEPVRRVRALIVDRDLKGRRHLAAGLTKPSQIIRIVPVVDGILLQRNNEIIPQEPAALRHRYLTGKKAILRRLILGLCGSSSLQPKFHELFSDFILPKTHPHAGPPSIGGQLYAQPHDTFCLYRAQRPAIISIL